MFESILKYFSYMHQLVFIIWTILKLILIFLLFSKICFEAFIRQSFSKFDLSKFFHYMVIRVNDSISVITLIYIPVRGRIKGKTGLYGS